MLGFPNPAITNNNIKSICIKTIKELITIIVELISEDINNMITSDRFGGKVR